MLTRQCPFCRGRLGFVEGYDRSGPDYGGNSKEVDTFQCNGCQRQYRHIVRERFTGNTEWWGIKVEDRWDSLPEENWPKIVDAS